MQVTTQKLFQQAYRLSLFTILYNILEGFISMYWGYEDQTLALFGFGVDSFIEVLSGIGIAVMIHRIRQSPQSAQSSFEQTALRITGFAFYILSIGLATGIVLNLIEGHKPDTTLGGIVVSLLSILVMIVLMKQKRKVGGHLQSDAILADANCTKVCVYMSVVLLFSSLIYALTGFAYADLIGSAGLIYFSVSEGKEAFEKAKGKQCGCGHACKNN